MRGWTLWAVLGSVLAHAATVTGLVWAMPAARPPVTRRVPLGVKVVQPAAQPVAPAAVVAPAPAPAPHGVDRRPAPAPPRAHVTPAPAPPPAPRPSPSPMMTMRFPVAAPAPIVAIPTPQAAAHDDAAAGDATPGARLDGPIAIPHVPGPHSTTGAGSGLGADVVGDGEGGYREEHTTFTARVKSDGSVHFDDRANFAFDDPLNAHFDLTDALMRAHGEDPYRYEKEKFLDRTREVRNKMALADRSDKLRGAIDRMPAYLAKIWASPKWTAAQRRRVLFALWDEVAEDGDAEVVATGAAVRISILAFIRKHLPLGSADAYTKDELAALNQGRTAKATFTPY